MATSRKQIVKLAENTMGHDIAIGDVHGNYSNLQAMLNKLAQNDRLIIVGDLSDRGAGSLDVIKACRNDNRVFVARGNHEDMCIDCIKNLESLIPNLQKLFEKNLVTPNSSQNEIEKYLQIFEDNLKKQYGRKATDAINEIRLHLINGGLWTVQLFLKELQDGKITLGKNKYSDDSDIKLVKDYFSQLPYVMTVEGKYPVNIVHANMPKTLTDKVIKEIADNPYSADNQLTQDEIKHATWARQQGSDIQIYAGGQLDGESRNAHSKLTLVGHNIFSEDTPENLTVRADTNTINLDNGSWYNNFVLVVNLTTGSCNFVGRDCDKVPDFYIQKAEEIVNHLNAYRMRLDQERALQQEVQPHHNTAAIVSAMLPSSDTAKEVLQTADFSQKQSNVQSDQVPAPSSQPQPQQQSQAQPSSMTPSSPQQESQEQTNKDINRPGL